MRAALGQQGGGRSGAGTQAGRAAVRPRGPVRWEAAARHVAIAERVRAVANRVATCGGGGAGRTRPTPADAVWRAEGEDLRLGMEGIRDLEEGVYK